MSDEPADAVSSFRSEHLIEAWAQKYVAGEIEVEELEDGIGRALTGRSDAATDAQAEAIRALRREPDEWFVLAHERHMREFVRRATQR